MVYTPPDSVVITRLQRTFPAELLRERAAHHELVERERDFDVVAFFWALTLGFAADNDRTVQAFLERFVSRSNVEDLAYNSFRNWFTPAFLDLLYDLLKTQLAAVATRTSSASLGGRLERFRDVLIADASFVELVDSAADVYNAYHDDTAGATVHLTASVATRLPTRFQITDGTVHERSKFRVGPWVEQSLLLFDLGYYDFWLFDRIDANGGWFLTRLKSNANPTIIEECRTWRGNAIPLAGKQLQDVLGDLHRDVIDVRAEVSFRRQPYNGTRRRVTATFRVVGLWNDGEERYHLYITNLAPETFDAAEIAQLYRLRWEIELLFRELKSNFGLERIRVSEPVTHELTDHPIRVTGTGQASGRVGLYDRPTLTGIPATQQASQQAYEEAGVGPEAIDFAEVHDCFSIAEIMAYEDLGFAEKGTGGEFIERGATEPDGEVPVNLSGGLKSKGHPIGATGTGQIVELFAQLRGEAGDRQVEGLSRGLAHNVGGSGGAATVAILEEGWA